MSSAVDICNLALAHLGDVAQVGAITPPDGTIQSAHCARFYPMARAALLEMHPWSFAVKRADISLVTNELEDDWSYAYALPSTCIRPLAARSPGGAEAILGNEGDAGSQPFIVETAEDGTLVLYTNVETAKLRYIDLVTDSTKYTPLFVLCLSRLLSSYLAGPILKGDKGMQVAQGQFKLFEREYLAAAAHNANVGKREVRQSHRPAWLVGRMGAASE